VVKDLYTENNKTLMKKMKMTPQYGKETCAQGLEEFILLKAMYIFNAIPLELKF
jgi:hypothetical protein